MKYKMKAIVGENHFELWQGGEKVRIIGNPIMAFHVEDTLNMETAPLHAEIERLKAENAKLRKFVQDVGDLVMALPKDAPLELKYEGDSILLNSFREQAGELIAEWEESEADNDNS